MNKKVRVGIRLGAKILWITVLLFTVAAQQVFAEVKSGIIKDIKISDLRLLGGNRELNLFVDTVGNRIPDHILRFPDPTFGWTNYLQGFVEKGMEVIFDDNGGAVASSGVKVVDGHNAISIDGSNMIDLFPSESAKFKFAAEAKRREQAQPAAPAQRPVTPENPSRVPMTEDEILFDLLMKSQKGTLTREERVLLDLLMAKQR
jgi:hypothetical protein